MVGSLEDELLSPPINRSLLAADWWFPEGHRLSPKELNALLFMLRSLAAEVEDLRGRLATPTAPLVERRPLDHTGKPEDD